MKNFENDVDLQPLNDKKIEEELIKLSGWERDGNKIVKTFEFESFGDGVKFIYDLTPFFNSIDHHPDIEINYKKIKFSLTRFSVGERITERDFTVAKKVEENFIKKHGLEID